jgi:ribosomal protein S24E
MNIIQDKDNFLFNRKEIRIIVEAEKSPSFEQASDIVSKEFKVEKDNIVIKEVRGKFGRNTFLISGFIYKTKEDKEKFEPKKKEKKKEGEEAAPAPAPAEKPAEEKKSEPAPEEKKE